MRQILFIDNLANVFQGNGILVNSGQIFLEKLMSPNSKQKRNNLLLQQFTFSFLGCKRRSTRNGQ